MSTSLRPFGFRNALIRITSDTADTRRVSSETLICFARQCNAAKALHQIKCLHALSSFQRTRPAFTGFRQLRRGRSDTGTALEAFTPTQRTNRLVLGEPSKVTSRCLCCQAQYLNESRETGEAQEGSRSRCSAATSKDCKPEDRYEPPVARYGSLILRIICAHVNPVYRNALTAFLQCGALTMRMRK